MTFLLSYLFYFKANNICMKITYLTIIVLLSISSIAFYYAKNWALNIGKKHSKTTGQRRGLNSTAPYHGLSVVFSALIPALFILSIWTVFDDTVIDKNVYSDLPSQYQTINDVDKSLILNKIKNIDTSNPALRALDPELFDAALKIDTLKANSSLLLFVLVSVIALIGAYVGWRRIKPQFTARASVERVTTVFMMFCACVAILTTLGIVFSVLFESVRFFDKIPFSDFMFGTEWSPQVAVRADQVGATGKFGAIPLLVGTLLISAIAMVIAIPIGLLSAIFLAEYASAKFRSIAKPALEILAGIPTIVYGFFAALTVAPFIRDTGDSLGLNVASDSALAAGLVMGIMIIPFVSSLSDDIISAIPQSLRDGSLGLGATKSETIKRVVFPAALPGIMGGVLLAVSRAIGETMIVVMAAGLAANLTFNPIESVTTVTVQIVTLLVGDQEFDSAKTLAAFALGLMLFVITLVLNIIALYIVRKYREQYD